MGLDALHGNTQLKTSLSAAIRQEKLSHSYLICGAPGSGRRTLARLLAAAMECTAAPAARPCLCCAQCRKVLNGTHPDVITVDDEGKKTVSVKTVRTAREDLYVRPNEGRRKVYVLPRAMDLNASGENALLKVMEEPPDYGAYLLLAEHPSQLLPTIRSRCVTLRLSPLTRAEFFAAAREKFPTATAAALDSAFLRSGGILGAGLDLLSGAETLQPQTLAFAEAFASKSTLGLLQVLQPMEKLPREKFTALLREWTELLQTALTVRAGLPSAVPAAAAVSERRTAQEIYAAVEALKAAEEYAEANVNLGTLSGALQVQLKR